NRSFPGCPGPQGWRRQGEEPLRHATAGGLGVNPRSSTFFLGRLYLAQGDLEAVIRVLDRGLALCRAADDWDTGKGAAAGLGYAYALVGRLAEGRALLEEALRASRPTPPLHPQSPHLSRLTAASLLSA